MKPKKVGCVCDWWLAVPAEPHVTHNQHTSVYSRAQLVRRLLEISHERLALLCIKRLKVVA